MTINAGNIDTARYVGFRGDERNPFATWALFWEYLDGAEGGRLWLAIDSTRPIMVDYDGAADLPEHVCRELRRFGVTNV